MLCGEEITLTGPPLDLKLRPYRPDVPCQQRRFGPDQLFLVQGVRFGVGRVERSSSMVILLGLREDDMVRCNA